MEGEFAAVEGKPHLGGYIYGGDDATYYPVLWDWLVNEHRVRSVLDVGCGEGHALRYFRGIGIRARGIDGVPQPDSDIFTHDFTEGPCARRELTRKDFDLVWCCEVLEHVEEQYLPNMRLSLTAAPLVLVTHAAPDQPGFHHVNCKTAEYWQGVFAGWGYRYDGGLTQATRMMAATNRNPWNHYVRSGLVFLRG